MNMSYYTAMITLTVMTLIILAVLSVKNRSLPAEARLGFITSASLVILAACCECLGVLFNAGNPILRPLHILVKFIELSVAPMIPVVCGNAIHPIRSKRLVQSFLILHTLIEFLSIWLGVTFYVDSGNVYRHCSFYWIYYLAYGLSIALFAKQIVHFGIRYQSPSRSSLLLILAFLLGGILCQALNSELKIVWLTVAIGLTLFYVYYADLIQQIDALTELLNRRSYENRIVGIRQRAAVIFFDVDGFKSINDRFGHPYGDACLKAVGIALKSAYGKYGLCYRIGGDEFCVILSRYLDSVERRNTSFCKKLDTMRRLDPRLPHVSYGYAIFEPGKMAIADAIASADQMMYDVKGAKLQENACVNSPSETAELVNASSGCPS